MTCFSFLQTLATEVVSDSPQASTVLSTFGMISKVLWQIHVSQPGTGLRQDWTHNGMQPGEFCGDWFAEGIKKNVREYDWVGPTVGGLGFKDI